MCQACIALLLHFAFVSRAGQRVCVQSSHSFVQLHFAFIIEVGTLYLYIPHDYPSEIFDACFPVLLYLQWIYGF